MRGGVLARYLAAVPRELASGVDLRARVLAALKQHGREATSFQVLEPDCRHWFDGDGCVGYVDTGTAWVAAGSPVAREDRVGALARGFVEAAREAGRRAVFFGVEGTFREFEGFAAVKIGEQPIWDPCGWAETLAGARSLREQLRRARARGVTVSVVEGRELEGDGGARARALDAMAQRFVDTRGMAPMGFLVDLQPRLHAEEKRYVFAERDGEVVEALTAVPVYARGGWLIEDILRGEGASNGCSELLIDAVMRVAAKEGSRYTTLGMVPLAGVDGWMRAVADKSAWLYDFNGLQAFRARLRPRAWEPVYLAMPKGTWSVTAVIESLRAFARGSIVRFGLATLAHRVRRARRGVLSATVTVPSLQEGTGPKF